MTTLEKSGDEDPTDYWWKVTLDVYSCSDIWKGISQVTGREEDPWNKQQTIK